MLCQSSLQASNRENLWGEDYGKEEKSPVVTILKPIQARSNMPEVPTFSVVWLMTTGWHCSLFVVYEWKRAGVNIRDNRGNQWPITCQNSRLLKTLHCFQLLLLFSSLEELKLISEAEYNGTFYGQKQDDSKLVSCKHLMIRCMFEMWFTLNAANL